MGKTTATLSRAFGAPVLLESFTRMNPIGGFVKPGKQPLYKVLIGLEKAGYIWERGDGAFRIRPRDWALQRSYEIPESFLAHYWAVIERQGELTIDDLGAMVVALSDEQINHTFKADPDWSRAAYGLANCGDAGLSILRMYGLLSSEQKQVLRSEERFAFRATHQRSMGADR